jgi:CBS domain-containing protein
MLIRDLLKNKISNLVAVSPDDDIREAASTMIEQTVSALVVLSQDGHLAGILTERDVARFFAASETGASAPVSKAMSSDVITCSDEHRVSEIVEIMSDSNIRHVPVLADGHVSAIITIRDIVRFHLSALESENQTLRELVAALD